MASGGVCSEEVPLLRIKRLRSEDPVEALLVHQSSKRAKVQFDYVGTRSEPEPKDLPKKDVKERTKGDRPKTSSLQNRREATGARSSQSRYEFVSKSREEPYCELLKVQTESISCNDVPLVEPKDYVYDFYCSSAPQSELDFTSVTNVYAYDFIVNESSSDEFQGGESDDSNDENNYRNDYPDEESDENGCLYGEDHSDEDYYGQFERLRIREELSSEDELYEDEDEVSRMGSAYLRFKKRIIADQEKKGEDSDDS